MRRVIVGQSVIAVITSLLMSAAWAQTPQGSKEPMVLRGMGSFHIGGRFVDIKGKPVREVSIGGATQKLDPNGTYLVEQMYVQYLLPQNRKGKFPLLMWHGGGFTGVTFESTPMAARAGRPSSSAKAGTPMSPMRSSADGPAGRCRKCSRASRCF